MDFVKLPNMSCIEPHSYSGQLTLLECQDMCISLNCEYISRPSTSLHTDKASCWYTSRGGRLTGKCQEDVYRNKKMVEGRLFSMIIIHSMYRNI